MQLMMAIHETAEDFAKRTDPVLSGPYWGAWMAYASALHESGLMLSGNGLQPPATATVLKLRDGKRQVEDGPFADTKEQLAGYFILDVPDMETALDWAARCPAAPTGFIELRPVLPPPPRAG